MSEYNNSGTVGNSFSQKTNEKQENKDFQDGCEPSQVAEPSIESKPGGAHLSKAAATLAAMAESFSKRPQIICGHRCHEAVESAMVLLRASHETYVYNNQLAEITKEEQKLCVYNVWSLIEKLSRLCDWFEEKYTAKGAKVIPTEPPSNVANMMLSCHEYSGFRTLKSVALAPFLREDGTICSTPGYDKQSCVFLSKNAPKIELPENPAQEDAKSALEFLLDPLFDFPFNTETDKSVALAALLTVVARPAIGVGCTPAFVFTANTPGTGKGLLADVLALIATGQDISLSNWPKVPEELDKMLFATARTSPQILSFDDVGSPFGGNYLQQVVTGSKLSGRILGQSKSEQYEWRTVIFANGNNVTITRDMNRRVLVCNLLSKHENPESRTDFKYPELREHVRAIQPQLLRAALIILSAHARNTKKNFAEVLGSFERWSKFVASALVWLGLPDPTKGLAKRTNASDDETNRLAALLELWREIDPGNFGLTTAEILEKSKFNYNLKSVIEALCPLKRGEREVSALVLGQTLRKLSNRRVRGKFIESRPNRHTKVQNWHLGEDPEPQSLGDAGIAAGIAGIAGIEHPAQYPHQKPAENGDVAGIAGIAGIETAPPLSHVREHTHTTEHFFSTRKSQKQYPQYPQYPQTPINKPSFDAGIAAGIAGIEHPATPADDQDPHHETDILIG